MYICVYIVCIYSVHIYHISIIYHVSCTMNHVSIQINELHIIFIHTLKLEQQQKKKLLQAIGQRWPGEPNAILAIVIVLGFPPELEHKDLSLKTCTAVKGHENIELVPGSSLSPGSLSSHRVYAGCPQRDKSSIALPSYEPCE